MRRDLEQDDGHFSVLVQKVGPTGQSDPRFMPTSSLMKTPTPSTDDLAQEDLVQKVPRTSGKAITTKWCDSVLY